jgi:hypothetical protein
MQAKLVNHFSRRVLQRIGRLPAEFLKRQSDILVPL